MTCIDHKPNRKMAKSSRPSKAAKQAADAIVAKTMLAYCELTAGMTKEQRAHAAASGLHKRCAENAAMERAYSRAFGMLCLYRKEHAYHGGLQTIFARIGDYLSVGCMCGARVRISGLEESLYSEQPAAAQALADRNDKRTASDATRVCKEGP